jgi:hypothetical protein
MRGMTEDIASTELLHPEEVESQFLTVIFSIINNGSDGHVSDGPT